MRAALYARVSSDKQREARTIEAQLPALEALAARLGWTIAERFIDDGASAKAGNLAQRPAALRLLAAAASFEGLVVYDIDRLTRSESQRGLILGTLQEAGVKIATVTKGTVLDLDTDEGDLMAGLDSYFAASWLRKHRARTRDGKLRAIAAGRKPAGPTPYGLAFSRSSGAWSIDDRAGAAVRAIFTRVAAGDSCAAIARDLQASGAPRPRAGFWGRERVWAIVRSRTYVGEWTADKRRGLVVRVPVIVDEALWQAAQEALAALGKHRGARSSRGAQRARPVGDAVMAPPVAPAAEETP